MIASTEEQREHARRAARVRHFFTEVAEALGPYVDLPDDVVIRFDLEGQGGGVFAVRREDERLVIVHDEAVQADCHLRCAVDDFLDLLRGRLDSRRGFLEGRLEVEGDIGLALRLERALARTDTE